MSDRMSDRVNDRAEISGGVVVGYDGLPPAERALLWAAQDCARRSCQLHVLRAWTIPTAPRPRSWSPSYVPGLAEFEAAVRAEVEHRVSNLLEEHPDVEWTVHPVYGHAAKALIAASEGADLLVVGHRGVGGLAGLLAGSVSEQCVKNARCPVVVVHTEPEG